jgi:conjugal transfer ATP-binding protein TraC
MDYLLRQKALFDRNHLSEVFPTRSYDPDTKLFWCVENDEGSSLAACWVCHPLPGVSEDVVSIINGMVSSEMPDDSFLSVSLVSSTFVTPMLSYYREARRKVINDHSQPQKASLAAAYVENRMSLFESGMKTPLDIDTKVLLKDKHIIITLKVPSTAEPNDDDIN